MLAQNLKGHRYKSKIPFVIHPGNKQKEYHPPKIADAFSYYYSSLYNLKNDPMTHEPTPEAINSFLSTLPIPKPSNSQLNSLTAPLTEAEIYKIIVSPEQISGPRWLQRGKL